MADLFSPEKRSEVMRAVRGANTRPEMIVRRMVHGLGYRYRLHVRSVPGCPDMVFPGRRKIIFVHGCFWHQHACKRGDRMPKARRDYWKTKLRGNKIRDAANRRRLRRLGWRVLVVWECQIQPKKMQKLAARIIRFLED